MVVFVRKTTIKYNLYYHNWSQLVHQRTTQSSSSAASTTSALPGGPCILGGRWLALRPPCVGGRQCVALHTSTVCTKVHHTQGTSYTQSATENPHHPNPHLGCCDCCRKTMHTWDSLFLCYVNVMLPHTAPVGAMMFQQGGWRCCCSVWEWWTPWRGC